MTPTPSDLEARLAAQQLQIDALCADLAALHPPTEAPRPPGPSSMGRRTALRAAAGVAAGAVAAGAASTLGAAPAAAANGNALVLGSGLNEATSPTGLAVRQQDSPYGLAVTDFGLGSFTGRAAVLGHATGAAFDVSLYGLATNAAVGVAGSSPRGSAVRAVTVSGTAVEATSDSGTALVATADEGDVITATTRLGTAGWFSSANGVAIRASAPNDAAISAHGRVAVRAHPASTDDPREEAPTGGSRIGDIVSQAVVEGVTYRARLWYCTDAEAGAWRVLAGPDSAGSLHLLPAPARVYDSRPGTTPAVGTKTPLVANQLRALDLAVNGSGVPIDATGALLTILLVNAASGAGNFTVWSTSQPRPQANTMVWGGSTGRFCTSATTGLDGSARVQVVSSLKTDLVVDVVGYYR